MARDKSAEKREMSAGDSRVDGSRWVLDHSQTTECYDIVVYVSPPLLLNVHAESLEQTIKEEKDAMSFTELPYHFMEISLLLLSK